MDSPNRPSIRDDTVLASVMLHDICEDCGVKPEELPFSDEVREIVRLLTKDPEHKHDPGYDKEYYDALKKKPKAAIVNALDRCNNVSTMATLCKSGYVASRATSAESSRCRIIADTERSENREEPYTWTLLYDLIEVNGRERDVHAAS